MKNPNNNKPRSIQKRKDFYDRLAKDRIIDGITSAVRDEVLTSRDSTVVEVIRLNYDSASYSVDGAKEGILLEAGFKTISPSNPITISSWAYEKAVQQGVYIIGNRAIDIAC